MTWTMEYVDASVICTCGLRRDAHLLIGRSLAGSKDGKCPLFEPADEQVRLRISLAVAEARAERANAARLSAEARLGRIRKILEEK